MEKEEVEKFADKIVDIEERAALCESCVGIKECQQATPGVVEIIEPWHGFFGTSVKHCRYEIADRERKRQQNLFRFSRVPAQYSGKTFADYKETPANTRALRSAKWVVEKQEKGALFYGPPGTGKTLLAAIIVNELVSAGQPAMFASLPDLLNDIRASYDKGNSAEVLQAVNDVPFLVLDDFGAERMTPWVGEQLFGLINSRIAGKRITVITSNYTPEELIRRMETVDGRGNVVDDIQGRRIMSRVHEMCFLVEVKDRDWRMGAVK